MTSQYSVWKIDRDLNILINHQLTGASPAFRGISYNQSNGLIDVVAEYLKEIQVFNLDLNLIRFFSTLPHTP